MQIVLCALVQIPLRVLEGTSGADMVAGVFILLLLAMFVFSIIFAVSAYGRQSVNIPMISAMARKQAGIRIESD